RPSGVSAPRGLFLIESLILVTGSDDIGLTDWTERESGGNVKKNGSSGLEIGRLHPPLPGPRPDVTISVGESWSLPVSFAGSALLGGASGNLRRDLDGEVEVPLERGQPPFAVLCGPAPAFRRQLAHDGDDRFVHVCKPSHDPRRRLLRLGVPLAG